MGEASSVSVWLLAVRPKTLTAALVPIVVGTAIAYLDGGTLRLWVAGLALAASFFIQVGTNFVNDAIDFKKGADTEERVGPVRVTQSGLLSAKAVMAGGAACFVVAVLLGAPLVWVGGWPILVIGLFSVACGYGYTGGPFPLAYVGLGDVFVMLFFGLIAVTGTHFLVSASWSVWALLGGLQVGAHATVLIAINNLRDRTTDARVGKRTLAVRLGERGAKGEITALAVAPFVLGFAWCARGAWWAALLPLLSLPVAVTLIRDVLRTPPSAAYNGYLARSAKLHLLFGLLLAAGLSVSLWLTG